MPKLLLGLAAVGNLQLQLSGIFEIARKQHLPYISRASMLLLETATDIHATDER